MVQVELQDNGLILDITVKYHKYYAERMKKVPASKFYQEERKWTVPVGAFDDLEEIFRGELVFITPRHKITGEAPPPAPDWYFHIPRKKFPMLKIPLYPFQEFGASFLTYRAKERGFGLLCDQMGLGKSPQAVAAAEDLIKDKLVSKVLIVCLSSLKRQWADEVIKVFSNRDCVVIKGTAAQRKKLYAKHQADNTAYTIINYELLLRDMDYLAGQYDLVIFDEAHKIKSYTSQTNIAAQQLLPQYKFFLTGTPMMNRPDELYGIFKVGNPEIFGKISHFNKEYCRFHFNGKFSDLVGYQNLDKLRGEIGDYILRRTDEEVQMELPKLIPRMLYVEPTDVQTQLINRIDLELKSLQDKLKQVRLTGDKAQIMRLDGAIQGCIALKIGASDTPELFTMSKSQNVIDKYKDLVQGVKTSPKLQLLIELIEEIVSQGNKVVIFTQFERMTRIIQRELSKFTKVLTYVGTGEMTENQREANKNAFREDTTVKVLVCTDAGSTGLNLQVAKYLVNYDLPWNPAIYDQRNGRIKRINSKHDQVFVLNFFTRGTMDESVWNAIKAKQNLANALVGNDEGSSDALRKLSQ